jgi:hypothetical protein
VDSAGKDGMLKYLAGEFLRAMAKGDGGMKAAHVAKSVIHSWNDRDAVRILTNCRHAIRRAGTMLLIERINRGVWAIL